jgi:hypothetical protein
VSAAPLVIASKPMRVNSFRVGNRTNWLLMKSRSPLIAAEAAREFVGVNGLVERLARRSKMYRQVLPQAELSCGFG